MTDNEDESLESRFIAEKSKMEEALAKLERKDARKVSYEFLDMAENYFKDSGYFYERGEVIRAFEAIVISWAYVDAGIKAGFFSVPEELKDYFTS
ncbi:MAG: DUF357 domain-containing protein [Candidatus Parvarchaeota archaeon]|jgi:hypothetical protein|nr:DUF357 domain-containing protein [Candidatus Parvarchaeota archaeon]